MDTEDKEIQYKPSAITKVITKAASHLCSSWRFPRRPVWFVNQDEPTISLKSQAGEHQ